MNPRRRVTPLSEPQTLRCTLCQRENLGTLPELDRAGWDWFTGDLPVQAEFCPGCVESRTAEIREMARRAGLGWNPGHPRGFFRPMR